jgi:uncharacterized protein (TIGR03435 family)
MLRLLIIVAVLACPGRAQPSFEVASLKPLPAGASGRMPLRGGPGTDSPGRLSGVATLKVLLMKAYELKDFQIAGPAWLDSERYQIDARIPEGSSKVQAALMLRALIAERFGLVAHDETRELPFYALVVAKNGPKLTESSATTADAKPPTARPRFTTGADGFPELGPGEKLPRSYEIVTGGSDGLMYKLWARRETMDQLADRLSAQLNRPVVDMTGRKGQYDFALAWTMESTGGTVPRTNPPPDEIDFHNTPVLSDAGVSIFAAVQAQLGLRLEQRRGPLAMLVVDKVEKTPTGN